MANNNHKKTAIVPANLAEDVVRFQEMAQALGITEPSLDLLPRITLKHAGTVAYGIQTASGEDIVKEFEAIALHLHPARVHWHGKFGESEEQRPECSSLDALTGRTDKGDARICAGCEFDEWGSGPDSRGKACRKQIRCFLYLSGKRAPHFLIIPVTSVKAVERYWFGLYNEGLDIRHVTTIFSAEKLTSADNIAFSGVAMKKSQILGQDIVDALQPMRNVCAALAKHIPVMEDVVNGTSDDFSETGDAASIAS